MKCSVFIATSLDGFIARNNGSVDWLHTSGKPDADMRDQADMGFNDYLSSIDCIIMGRKCMEVISNMNLTADQWPYGDKRIIVLSNTLSQAPENMKGKIELYSGDLTQLIEKLENEGHEHAYIDGGKTIQSFIQLGFIKELTISKAPIILGEGIPLFDKMNSNIELTQAKSMAYPNDFIQIKYTIK